MLLVRRLLLIASLIGFVACIVLLLNITAPNPTHRRYSSRVPLNSVTSTSSQAIGLDGEQVLASDLGVPSNNNADQRLCFCKGSNVKPDSCKGCAASYAALTASFRIPDFLTKDLIVESKNRQTMDPDDRDLLNQIGDYSLVAIKIQRPLWIYVRVDTDVDPIYEQLATATSGGVVRYFAVPGYIDPVDEAARIGILVTGFLAVVSLVIELIARRRRLRATYATVPSKQPIPVNSPRQALPRTSPPPQSPGVNPDAPGSLSRPSDPPPSHPPRPPSNPLSRTIEALNNAEKAAKHTRDKLDL